MCAVAEGEVVYSQKVTPSLFVSTEPEPIPPQALATERFFIPVLTAGILEGSAWTQARVEERFLRIRKFYSQCGVELDRLDSKVIPNPHHKYDDIEDDMYPRDSMFVVTPFEKRMGEMIQGLGLHAPAILFLKNVWDLNTNQRICAAEARAFIVEKIVPKISPIAGMAIVSESYSPDATENVSCKPLFSAPDYLVDAHELGHLLLNDGGHSTDANNLMASGTILDDTQCAKIRASPFVHREPRR